MSCYTEYFEVMSQDVDPNRNAKPSVITRFFQETGNHHMRDRGPTYYELFDEGKSYILVRYSCEVLEPLKAYDKVRVDTWTTDGKGATFIRSFKAFVEDREVARAYSEWAVVDINSGRLLKVSEVDTSGFERGEALELSIPNKFHIDKNIELESCGQRHVRYSDCDINHHMNNTHYPDILMDFVPDVQNKTVTAFSIRFMSEGTMGGVLDVFRARSAEIIADPSNPEETWFFKTMIGENKNIEAIVNLKTM